jgi:hypothetical protein
LGQLSRISQSATLKANLIKSLKAYCCLTRENGVQYNASAGHVPTHLCLSDGMFYFLFSISCCCCCCSLAPISHFFSSFPPYPFARLLYTP